MAVLFVAVVLVFAGQASAVVLTVALDGDATGRVTSTPAGIDCANTGGGAPGPVCSFDFDFFATVSLTAVPDAPGVFGGWAGNTFSGTCNSGDANPCSFTSAVVATVTASFDPPPEPPAVSTEAATGVRAYSASLQGLVDPGGLAVEECRFEYGRTAAYGRSAPCAPQALGTGTGDVPVRAHVGLLDPDTTYHYRVVAENVGGSRAGDDRTFVTASPPADECANAELRVLQRIELPYCMALELVSPARKDGMAAMQPSIGADGEAVRFKSPAGLADTPGLINPLGDWYVAERGEKGWGSVAASTPAEYGRISGLPTLWSADFRRWFALSATESQRAIGQMRWLDGGVGREWLFRGPLLAPLGGGFDEEVFNNGFMYAVSPDFSRLFFSPGGSGVQVGLATYLAGDPVPQGTTQPNTYVVGFDGDEEGGLALLARDGDGKVWGGSCGATVGGRLDSLSGISVTRRQGALSLDGGRALFTTRPGQGATGACDAGSNKLRIMERVETPGGVEISELVAGECDRVAPVCSTADGDDSFEGASVDQTKVFFTTSRQLADTDLDTGSACSGVLGESAGCDLYLYDSELPEGERLVQVSAGDDSTPGSGATVLSGVTAISGDGSHVYFVASGVITDDANPEGATAVAGQPNLYAYTRNDDHPNGKLAFVATVDPVCVHFGGGGGGGAVGGERDCRSLSGSFFPTFLNQTAAVPFFAQDEAGVEVGGDGHVLVFMSSANLTADDTDPPATVDVPPAVPGVMASAGRDIYRYDSSADTLERVSKAAPGGSDNGPFNVDTRESAAFTTASVDAADVARWVSEDGRTVVFSTFEQLVAEDTDDEATVYMWRDGETTMLPGNATLSEVIAGGATYRISDPPVLSRSGDQVAFGTSVPLLAADGDIARDVYVARVGGGFVPDEAPAGCSPLAGVCQDGGQGATPADPRTESVGDRNALSVRNALAVRALSAAQRRRAARSGVLRLRVRARHAGRVTALAKSRVGGRMRRVGRVSRRVQADRAVTVALRLDQAARRQLGRTHRLRLTVGVSAPGARTRTVTVLLRRTGR